MKSTGKIPERNIFSSRLIHLRQSMGKNASEMADFLGFSQPVYHRYEHGRTPKINTILVIAERCSVTANWLLGLDSVCESPLKTTSLTPLNEVPKSTSSHPCDEEDLKPGTTSLPPLNEAPKPAAVLHLDAGESSPPYGQPPDCRIPAGCDVAGEVAAMKARLQQLDADMSGVDQRLDHISTQLSTLLALLGGAMKTGLRSGDGADREKKAG